MDKGLINKFTFPQVMIIVALICFSLSEVSTGKQFV